MSVPSATEKPLDCGQAARNANELESKISATFKALLASLPVDSGAAVQAIEHYYNANIKGSDIKVVFLLSGGDEHYVSLYRNGGEKPFFTAAFPKEIWEFQEAKELEQDRKNAVAEFKKIADLKSDTVEKEVIRQEIMHFYHSNMFNLCFASLSPKETDGNHVLEFIIENGEVFDTVEISQHVYDQITEKRVIYLNPFKEPTINLNQSIIGHWKDILDKS